jgi:hypothetical protein
VTGAGLGAVNATENTSFSATMATFTDTGSHTSGDFTATINWGDGSTSVGTVTGSGNTFTVTGSHTYVNTDGALSTTVTASQTGAGGGSGSANSTATVSEADLTVTAQSISISENSAFSGTVATFTDPGADASGDFTATIAWGDGSISLGTVTGSGGTFTVTGSHTYVNNDGTFSTTVAVTEPGISGGSASSNSTATVSEADLTVTAQPIGATEGSSTTTTVATFTDPGADTSGEFTASINWGDGSTSTGTVTGSGGTFTVTGSHTYSNTNGQLTTTVSVTEPGVGSAGGSASSTSTATVTETGLTVTGAGSGAVGVTENHSFSATLGTFTDSGSHTSGDFTASINWGDGSTSTGTVTGSGGTFTVTGSHTYVNTDGFVSTTVSVTQTGAGGGSGSATNTATVSEADLSVTAKAISLSENSVFSGTAATFTDPGTDTSGEFTASINWGDGSTSVGTVTGSGGTFTVSGSHTYVNNDGLFSTTVSVTEPGIPAGSGSGVGTANVAEADLTVLAKGITATASSTATVQVATFTDPGTDTSGEFTASIRWGDGSTSVGTVTGSGGTFTVTGSHTYTTTTGSLTTTVNVTEPGAGSASATSTATVFPAVAPVTLPTIILINPPNGSSTSNPMPPITGVAATGTGILSTVYVKIYAGTTPTGTPVQSFTTTANSITGAYSTLPIANLPVGVYTVQTSQKDTHGHTWFSAPHTFTETVGAPFKLVFIQPPVNTMSGAPAPPPAFPGATLLPPITVQVEDQFGRPVPDAGIAVTVTINSTVKLGGTTTVLTNSSGLATFTNLTIAVLGQYIMTASHSGLLAAVSNQFSILPWNPPPT